MKRKRYWLLAAVVLTCLVGVGSAFAKPENPLWETKTLTRATERTELTTDVVPVEPGKKLEITFSGQTSGEFTVEANARIRLLNTSNGGSALNLQFLDAEGQRVEEVSLPIVTASAREYGRVVYPPSTAKSLKIVLSPGAASEMAVENVRVAQELDGVESATVNPHPNFAFGDLNSYGFGGEFFERPDGKTVWNSGFTGQSASFPVQGGASYELFARGIAYSGKRSRLLLQLFARGEKRPFHTIPIRFGPEGVSVQVVFPEGAVSANLLGYYVIVEEVKIIPGVRLTER